MSEHTEQAALIKWADIASGQRPELGLLFAIPNAGQRSRAAAGREIAQGLRAGIPDMFLPVARGGAHGLWIELKVGRNKPTPLQDWWLRRLAEQGYRAVVCYGWEAAKAAIEEYLTGETK